MHGCDNNAAFVKVLLAGFLVLAGAMAGQATFSADGSTKFTGGDRNTILVEQEVASEPLHDEDGEAPVQSFISAVRRTPSTEALSTGLSTPDTPRFILPETRGPPAAHLPQS